LAALTLPSAASLAGPVYSIADLGPASRVTALNNSGQVAGWFTDSSLTDHPLAPVSSYTGQSHGINDAGQLADFSADTQAALWSGGALTLLAGQDSYAISINSSGQIAGGAGGEAVRWSGGIAQSLGVSGAAYSINAAGNVAGTAELAPGVFRAFFWSPQSGIEWLPTLGGLSSYGLALNDSNQIAGNSTAADGYLHAFLRTGSAMLDLGIGSATGLNNSGQVVGTSNNSAYLYSGATFIDLNILIELSSGWYLEEAAAINDRDQIAGTGYYQGQRRGFRLDPAREPLAATANPEPTTIVLVLLGLALLSVGIARRRG
jgi:probable HAF family extracellular repeat protein